MKQARKKIWKWLNHVSVPGGWSPVQALIWCVLMTPAWLLLWICWEAR